MGNLFSLDFQEFLQALNDADVDYILVGGYAVILHGYDRVTGDMDIWVRCTKENYKKLESAFRAFGMPTFDMTLHNFLDTENFDVFRFGRKPVAIDIMTKVKGVQFDDAFKESQTFMVEEVSIRVIQREHLIEAKKQAGRNKDLNDLENLQG